MDIKKLAINNSQGVRSFQNILSHPATASEPHDTTETDFSNTARPEPFEITKPKPFDATGPKLAGTVIVNFLATSHFEKVDF